MEGPGDCPSSGFILKKQFGKRGVLHHPICLFVCLFVHGRRKPQKRRLTKGSTYATRGHIKRIGRQAGTNPRFPILGHIPQCQAHLSLGEALITDGITPVAYLRICIEYWSWSPLCPLSLTPHGVELTVGFSLHSSPIHRCFRSHVRRLPKHPQPLPVLFFFTSDRQPTAVAS